MTVLEKYFEIIDRPSTEVSRVWKMTHILCLTAASFFGFAASYAFAKVMEHFLDNCWLYPNIAYRHIPQNDSLFLNSSYEIKIDLVSTQWGSSSICNFVQFVPLVSVILGAILIAFFLMFPRGGTNFNKSCSIERSWHLICPTIFVSLIYLIILLECFSTYSRGANAFCSEFDDIIDSTNSDQCNKLIEKFTIELSGYYPGGKTFNPSVSAKIALSISLLCFCIFAWILEFLSLLLRVLYVVDFKILEVVIETQNENDQVQALTSETSDATSDTVTLETN